MVRGVTVPLKPPRAYKHEMHSDGRELAKRYLHARSVLADSAPLLDDAAAKAGVDGWDPRLNLYRAAARRGLKMQIEALLARRMTTQKPARN